MKPRIGITSSVDSSNPRGRFVSINANYTRSVAMAGGLPFVLPLTPEMESPESFLDGLDGLLISGGGDISPARYGEEPSKKLGLVSSDRDHFEFALVLEARKRGMPLFGICRGHQVINVALGGSLIQDIDTQIQGAIDHSPPEGQAMDELRHSIVVVAEARYMNPPLEDGKILVNSFHHQAVKILAPGLVETARAMDGINEAFEGLGQDWLLGVQFHPEALTLRYPTFLALFKAHVEAADNFARR